VLREATGRCAFGSEGFYDADGAAMRLAGARLVDVDDVDPVQNGAAATFERVVSAARRPRTVARLPVFVGGDPSLSFPLLRAYDDVPEVHVVRLDARLGFHDTRRGSRLSGASTFRRSAEDVPGLQRNTAIGMRSASAGREAVEAARARGHTLVTARRLRNDPAAVLEALPERAALYPSLYVDVFDPSIVPGTGDPEVDGLGYAEVLRVVEGGREVVRASYADRMTHR